MTAVEWAVVTESAEETSALGELLGTLLGPACMVLLTGDLGAGKTCLTRGIARGLQVPEDQPVTSPTFTLMNHYQGRLDLYHFDLYRLSHADELYDLGFEEYVDGPGVAIVEWADRMGPDRQDALEVEMEYLGESRRGLRFRAVGPRHVELLQGLRKAWSG